MIFETRICGIPCQCEVLMYHNDPGRTYGPPENCYPPEFEFEYQILDRKGYRAEWLERKITDSIEADLITEYEEYMCDY